tara:strand:- start:57 stop:269 length:213 start_codon:yes stop_codon:yes gene_type:complete
MKTENIIMKLFCLVLLLGAVSSIVLLVFKLQNKDDYEKEIDCTKVPIDEETCENKCGGVWDDKFGGICYT